MSFLYDARYALRSMARTPGFTAVALLMLALGTGANAAMFSVVDAVMLRSPFPSSEHVAVVRLARPDGSSTPAMSIDQYRALESSGVFERLGTVGSGTRPTLRGVGEPKKLNIECVSAGLFDVLGTPPLAGRAFAADEDRPGGASVVVLSYQFWRRELGGASDAVGRNVTLNDVPATIVGIMPRAFGGPSSRNNTDAWLPMGPATGAGSSGAGCAARAEVWAYARIRTGTTLDAAAAAATIASGIARIPATDGAVGANVTLLPIDELWMDEVRTPFLALLGGVGVILLIACANVANLQMERIFGRRTEIGVRMALGATRARIVAQTMTENLLLSLLGSAVGLLIASVTLNLIVGLMPGYVPHLSEIEVSSRVLAATLLIACAAGAGVGAIPAFHGTSKALMDDLRASSRSTTGTGGWTRRVLVVAQVSLSLTLLIGAALMIRTFLTLRPSDPGFNAVDKLTATLRLQRPVAPVPGRVFERVIERLRAIPEARSVEGSSYIPMSGSVSIVSVRSGGVTQDTFSGVVTPGYFAQMEIPIVRGRPFGAADGSSTGAVAIVNEAFVRKWWAGREPLGQSVDVVFFDKHTEMRQIVGVIRDTRSGGGDTRARAEIYFPLAQSATPVLHFIVRAGRPGDPRLANAIREAVSATDSAQVIDRIVPMQELLDGRVSTWRLGAWLLGAFAAIAIVLTAVGLAASIAWWVTQRSREIGIRMALGANPRDVWQMVLAQGVGLASAGVLLGLAGAAASTRLIASWLYGVTPMDPKTFAVSAAGMLVIAAVASYIPARRATRIDPLVALREQ